MNRVASFVWVSVLLTGGAHAQVSTHITYEDHIKKSRNFVVLDENLFGDKVSLQDGALSFAYDDVVLPTTSGLRVSIGRRSAANYRARNTPGFHVFGSEWDLDVPYMMGTYDSRDGWNAGNNIADNSSGGPAPNYNRCTAGHIRPRERLGPWPYYHTQPIYAHMYWKGVQINIPGQGNEQLLKLNPGQILPTNGTSYHGTTPSGWKISCLGAIKNGVGEGFKVTTNDGVTYHFDWMATRKAIDLTDNNSVDANGYGYDAWHLLAPLTDVYLFATKVEDRFGNQVIYSYDTTHPQRIKSIQAIETDGGARIDVNYNADGRISTIVAGSRVWTYTYSGQNVLQSLQLPDGSKWEYSGAFSLLSLGLDNPSFWSQGCAQNPGAMSASANPDPSTLPKLLITHPSGARGEFVYRGIYHGINNAPGGCGAFGSHQTGWSFGTWGVPSAYALYSLHSKKISGPGMTDRTWNYSYTPSWSFQSQCSSGCASFVTTSVAASDGVIRRYDYGNSYSSNYGQLLSERHEKAGVLYKRVDHGYLGSAAGQPFPDNKGDIVIASGLPDLYGNPFRFKNRPRASTVIRIDQLTQSALVENYSSTVLAYDAFARPIAARKQSTLGFGKTEHTEYHDNLNVWVIGQIQKQYIADTDMNAQPGAVGNVTTSETGYNALAQPVWVKKFGRLLQTLTYNADGTIATFADGGGKVTTLSNWKRSVPRLIIHPDNTTESATVDDNGWITSTTDENGFVTGYGYDAMGRLASIVYPTGDDVAYHSDLFSFQPLTDADWKPANVVNGQWRRFEVTGNRTRITYYDAMWRPALVHEYDATNISPTLRSHRYEYDSSGRLSFQSYPSADLIPGASGTRTYYDALDRVVRVEQDSEHGALATTTEYLSGLRVRVTNPRGHQVTTSYQAWDQPGYDLPILSEQPENTIVQIDRHPKFGWPRALTRRNAANTLSATRRYVYNGHAQMCKTIEPESGTSVVGYEASGNPSWSAAGLSNGDYANPYDCSYTAANASGRVISRNYDLRNRLTQLRFPDGRGNQVWTYTPDGLPASIATYNAPGNSEQVLMAYAYNKRRLLTGESITQFNGASPWYTWTIGYVYDAYAHLALQTYPTGLVVDYAPNVLGQATKAGSYASGALYYPNGALKQFTYGNGIVHTMQQNMRQLPSRVTSSGVNDLGYSYDANGNVTHIGDMVRGDNYSRWLSYDNLDRLTAAGSANFGGDHWHRFTYDALDNLESWKLAGVKDYADYVYDQQNRLLSIRNTEGATVVGLDYDPQGNLQNKNGQGYVFDYGNRLRSVTGKESYRYDGIGRRVQTISANGTTTLWQYSRSGQMLFWSDWQGSNYLNQKTHENVYLAGSLVATIDHAWPSNAVLAVKYQHSDALGSPVAVTNASAQVIERVDYEPWGAVIGNPTRSGIGYTGHMMDGATGLVYMQQRYYDPSVGRFLSTDPVQPNLVAGGNFNRYWYGANNPYRYRDPDGRYVCKATKADCVDFDRAMQSARTALSSSKLSGAEREALQRAVDFYGEKGDDKVTVEFGAIKDGDANISVQQDGTATVKFDPKKLARSNESNSMHALAKAIVHEGDHGANDRERGRTVETREERRQAEVSAYTAQAYYQKATGFVDLGMNGWAAWSGINHEVINRQADLSVVAACGSSTEGSCK